jgi:protein Mpv17
LLCGFWQAYCNALETSPLVTKAYTGVVGTLLGDVLAQLLSHQHRKNNFHPHRPQYSSSGRTVNGFRSTGISASDGSEGKKVHPKFQFDAMRCARLCLYSAAVGTPLGHYWYQMLEQHVMPGSPTAVAAIAAKVCMDQLLQTPFGMALFLGGMKVLEGRPAEVKQELQSKVG